MARKRESRKRSRQRPRMLTYIEILKSVLAKEFGKEERSAALAIILESLRLQLANQDIANSQIPKQWETPMNLLDTLITVAKDTALEAKIDYNDHPPDPTKEPAFLALIELQIRACQISSAILSLLRTGYPDEAYATWRTIHEICVFSCFIFKTAQEGFDTAQRYLDHQTVDQYEILRLLRDKRYTTDFRPDSDFNRRFHEIKERRNYLVNVKYKDSHFEGILGWARPAIKKNHPDLKSIEQYVGLENARVNYKMASSFAHANPFGNAFRLSTIPLGNDLRTFGPKSAEFSMPGYLTATELALTTCNLINIRTDPTNARFGQTFFMGLSDVIYEQFEQKNSDVNQKLERNRHLYGFYI